LATRAGKMEPSCPLGTTRCIPHEKFPRKPYNKSFIDQVCSVKMVGYWPRSFLASLWTSTSSRSINTQKKNLANIQPSWPHTWSITHTYPTRANGITVLVNSQTGFCRRFLFPQFYKASGKRIQLPVTRAPTPAITWSLHNKKLNESGSYANDNLSSTCGENQARII